MGILTLCFVLLSLPSLGRTETVPDCSKWEAFTDTDEKSALWQSIATHNLESVVPALKSDPCTAKARSKDGRGPLFWAYEFGDDKLVEVLLALGADPEAVDSQGKKPIDMMTDLEDEYMDEDDGGVEMELEEEEEEEDAGSWRDEF
uniref:Uncharacterized protein n=1 Tax=Tetraselmis chuii TaxID=63592 RepID=A0A6U1JKT3_9CHLO|mmetsp:Transcript_38393/g.68843  ORF Transcript_38393/g.68843 Transcript_38393/m.68843 type:complete len:146 (+) Transcript_38393:103-540(+)|eukprot:CAMPEP_0177769016 /NCGR_PEP_ID=MMETSP0491_2-20121128/10070_1 /TAXON_ID=63592 /ORGANISM="Tetraselmis chuii, Strain PLY429" /LENGTH=145 /DNA_ID=CAMNT_0019285943 /DNA_START=92 /DNA_END=529 /DNA_ORIENTATION=+